MAKEYWGERFETADLSTPSLRVFQPYKRNDDAMLLAVQSSFIFVGDATWTALNMRIYSDNGGTQSVPGTPGVLLHTSDNTKLKTTLFNDNNAIKTVYFEFNVPDGVPLRGSDWYHFVPMATGYTGTEFSHITWHAPLVDQVYRNADRSFEKLLVAPYLIATVSGPL